MNTMAAGASTRSATCATRSTGCVLATRAPLPEVLVAADGQAIAVRGADRQLAIHKTGSDTFAIKEWLAADGDARLPTDPALRGNIACDAIGCIGRLADGWIPSYGYRPLHEYAAMREKANKE